MAALPLAEIDVVASSAAERLGFTALADVAAALGGINALIIGGHMVEVHVRRWQVDLRRETHDADLGVAPVVIRDGLLIDRLQEMGYQLIAGNRFGREVRFVEVAGPGLALIDLLVPAYTSRVRSNLRVGDQIVTTEVPGLATAFQRDAIDVQLNVLADGEVTAIPVRVPDEVAALCLKVLARSVRSEDKDAVDVWRCLEVCRVADAELVGDTGELGRVKDILRTQFGRGGAGIAAIVAARRLPPGEATAMETRIQALTERVLP